METIWQDGRYAARLLSKQPGFAALAILTLALGVAASTAIFSVIDAALLRPLPYPNPHELVEIDVGVYEPGEAEPSYYGPSLADVRRWQEPGGPLAIVSTWTGIIFGRVVDSGEPERVDGMEILDNYLALHGLAPILGRDFNADDTRVGAPDVTLLGYGYWRRRYGADPDIVGKTISFDGVPATIVGVMPPAAEDVPVWLPLRVARDQRGSGRGTFARLRPGVGRETAEQQLSATVLPEQDRQGAAQKTTIRLTSVLEQTTNGYARTVNVIGGAVALVLLIACVNVAGLLLARGAARQPEFAVRASIGASRLRLVRQLLVESLVLSAAGGALGIFLAWLSLDLLVANIPMSLPSNAPATLNVTVLGASVGLVIATGLLFGLVPALRLSRVQVGATLAKGSRRHGSALSRRGGQLLIAAEIALAVVLVAGAGLMIRSFARVLDVDMGFDPDGIVTMELTPLGGDAAVHTQFYQSVVQTIRTLPGVAAAGAVDHMPLAGSSTVTGAMVDGRSVGIAIRQILPGYFEALGVPLRQGRLPTDGDHAAGPPFVIVNETGARELFPDGPAVGRQITVRKTAFTVLGVVGDIRHGGPFGRVRAEVFQPYAASADSLRRARGLTIVVRPTGDNPDLGNALRRAAQSVGPRVLIESVRTGGEWLGQRVITPRRRTVLLGLLGGLGLVLAVVGVFGMTAYSVSRRTQEIGVRMAFGARPAAMVWRVVRDSALPIAVGTLIGLGGAALATRLIATFLFQTDPIDPATFFVVALVLVVAGCLAAWIPARRAARVDPVMALRAE
jgi:predicted permease